LEKIGHAVLPLVCEIQIREEVKGRQCTIRYFPKESIYTSVAGDKRQLEEERSQLTFHSKEYGIGSGCMVKSKFMEACVRQERARSSGPQAEVGIREKILGLGVAVVTHACNSGK